MAPEQDWCLECGNAVTTRVQPPPSWGIPIAVALGALALLALVVVLTARALSDDADREAAGGPDRAASTTPARTATAPAAPGARTTPAAPGARTTPGRTETVPGAREATGGGAVPVWPRGEESYTVVAQTTGDRADAERLARELIAAGQDAGVLRTNGYDFFDDGFWVVWAGRYPDRAAAERAVPGVRRNASGAYATLIRRRPG